jgi:hypothetical protein
MTATTTNQPPARFAQLVRQWKAESELMSNTAQMAMLRSYQQIIGMGPAVVPLLLEELRREPDHWFWALEAITLENPVPPQDAGDLDKMAEAWVKWGVNARLIT